MELGNPIPDNTPHAVSVALPTWDNNVKYEEGDINLHGKLKSGYPRFVIHKHIKQLIQIFEARFAKPTETCLIFPSRRSAQECRDFIMQNTESNSRIAEYTLTPPTNSQNDDPCLALQTAVTLHIILFARTSFSFAKQYWQHTGEGISSRLAEHCAKVMAIMRANQRVEGDARAWKSPEEHRRKTYNRFYVDAANSRDVAEDDIRNLDHGNNEWGVFVEERFGRNLDVDSADEAKFTLKKRIAGLFGDLVDDIVVKSGAGRGVAGLTEKDVYLYPTGMSSIYNAFRVISKLNPGLRTIQFGFPYIDTLKIQERFGSGCLFLGHGIENDIKLLEEALQKEKFSALFCEFPSNPLLKSPDLRKLRKLADIHGFLIVVDETIGNLVNVSVLEFADIVVSSLTKIFSGDSNVMGG
ncbi:hypothetical protein HK096_009620, partial [Nowakowskiella sp. JEL0078]